MILFPQEDPILKKIMLIIIMLICIPTCLYAETLYLKTNDIITGKIINENDHALTINTEAMGEVSIDKSYIKKIISEEEQNSKNASKNEKMKITWARELSLGYNTTGGNTQTSQFLGSLLIHRKTFDNEFHTKGSAFYSSSNNDMTAQQWNAMIRYAYSFGARKWYNFYKGEADHDRFINIDHRLIPSAGIGYWFSDTDTLKSMVELGLGMEYIHYCDDTQDKTTPILLPRAFFEVKFFGESRLTEDAIFYPSLENEEEIRIHSETSLTNPINEHLLLKLQFIEDYNSEPGAKFEKHDYKFLSSLTIAF